MPPNPSAYFSWFTCQLITQLRTGSNGKLTGGFLVGHHRQNVQTQINDKGQPDKSGGGKLGPIGQPAAFRRRRLVVRQPVRRKLDRLYLSGFHKCVSGRLHYRKQFVLLVNGVAALEPEQHAEVIDLHRVGGHLDLLKHRLELVEEFVPRELLAEILKLQRVLFPLVLEREIIGQYRFVDEGRQGEFRNLDDLVIEPVALRPLLKILQHPGHLLTQIVRRGNNAGFYAQDQIEHGTGERYKVIF